MGDTQIQYSFLLEGHERRHAYKQLGFRVVPLPEAREVTRHWSALGKCISAGNTMGSRIIENDGIYLMRDIARLKSSCNFSAAAADRSSNTLLLTVINPLTDHNVTADGVLLRQIHHNFALQEVCRNNFQRQQVWKSLSFLLCFARLLPRGSLASNQRCHYPGRGLLMRDTSLRSWWGKKKHAQHFRKLLMFYPIIHRPRTWEYIVCGKALAGHGGTSIISACLPGVACVEITAPINKQSPSVEIFIQTELHPCGGLSEHSSCTLKGYSESHIWARVHLEINGVPLTGWVLSATQVH